MQPTCQPYAYAIPTVICAAAHATMFAQSPDCDEPRLKPVIGDYGFFLCWDPAYWEALRAATRERREQSDLLDHQADMQVSSCARYTAYE